MILYIGYYETFDVIFVLNHPSIRGGFEQNRLIAAIALMLCSWICLPLIGSSVIMSSKEVSIDDLVTLMGSAAAVDDSEDSFAHRRARYKAKPMDYQQKRREEALKKQKELREDRTNLARRLAAQSESQQGKTKVETSQDVSKQEFKDVEMSLKPIDSTATRDSSFESRQSKKYADQLQIPEPLVEIPPDFIESWLCVPKPPGHRCLVIGSQGKTYARLLDGSLLLSFDSILPGGSPSKGTKSDQFCILDCIYSPGHMTFYIIDVMCWNARVFYDCESDMRQIWAKSRVLEDGPFDKLMKDHAYRFVVVPHLDSNPESIAELSNQAAQGKLGYDVESLYFYHREGHYTHGLTPLMFELDIRQFSDFIIALEQSANVMKS